MFTKRSLRVFFGAVVVAGAAAGQSLPGQESWLRVLRMSDAEQIAFTKTYLDEGMPAGHGAGLDILVLNRSSLILPVLETKIEEVIRSKNPIDCFTNKRANPGAVVDFAASMISYPADEYALKELSKLVALDEKRFGRLVVLTLATAANHGIGFKLAYKGFELGNPTLDIRIGDWAEEVLKGVVFDTPVSLRRQWADVIAERYRGVPIGGEWVKDPIVSRMKPETAESLRPEMFRLAAISWEKHPRRMMQMSDDEQIAFAKSILERGIPYEQKLALSVLASVHSSLILPMIETKVEEVLKSPDQIEWRLNTSATPNGLLYYALAIISEAGDEQALRQLAKLMKAAKFMKPQVELFVVGTLNNAKERGNPFALAYRGLALGDPDLEKPILAWAEQTLAEPSLNIPKDARRQWAEAMANRYGAAPPREEWTKDPLLSRLKPSLAESLHNDLVRFAAESPGKRAEK